MIRRRCPDRVTAIYTKIDNASYENSSFKLFGHWLVICRLILIYKSSEQISKDRLILVSIF